MNTYTSPSGICVYVLRVEVCFRGRECVQCDDHCASTHLNRVVANFFRCRFNGSGLLKIFLSARLYQAIYMATSNVPYNPRGNESWNNLLQFSTKNHCEYTYPNCSGIFCTCILQCRQQQLCVWLSEGTRATHLCFVNCEVVLRPARQRFSEMLFSSVLLHRFRKHMAKYFTAISMPMLLVDTIHVHQCQVQETSSNIPHQRPAVTNGVLFMAV